MASRSSLLGLALLAILSFFVAGSLVAGSSAQGNRPHREAAFQEKADKILKRVRHAVDEDKLAAAKGRFRSETSQVKRLARVAGVQRRSASSTTVDLAVTLISESDAELKAAGFAVRSRIGDIATLEVEVDRLPDLAMVHSVRKMVASSFRHPLNDRARQSAGIDNYSGQRIVSQTGRGVVVGIIDTGIDFRHLDFTIPGSNGKQTRIKALLDMTVFSDQGGSQSPDPNWNYSLPGQSATIGHLYTEADLNAALQMAKPADQNSDGIKQRDKSGHGTHIAATAAGNGLSSPNPSTYAGMAPEAELIIVKASRENDGDDYFRTTDIINAMEFIKQRAAELGRPFVINLSLGSQLGPHDGTNPDERAIDNLVNGGSGRAVCVAAGNEGDSSIHARGTVPAGGSQTLDFNVNGAAEVVDLYQHQADRFTVTVTSPDGVSLGPVAYDANGFSVTNGQASNQYLEAYNANDDKGDTDAANDQPDIVLLFKPEAPDGMWKITLQDADGNANQSYDAWAEGEGVYFSTNVDHDSHLIASPGTARGAITVGAFVTRSATLTPGYAATFTSPGPTADGREKPEIGAPGYYLYSARSTDVTDQNFGTIGTGGNAPTDSVHYTGLAGTSMATSVTAGAVALFLESNAALTSDQIKDSIRSTATHDSFTGPADWDRRLGAGKLNIAAAIELGDRAVYNIAGHVDGTGGIGATLTLSGSQSATTNVDSNGNFRFRRLLAGGTYTITPSVTIGPYQYSFTPPSLTFVNLGRNETANFTAVRATISISGRITSPNGNGVAGIPVRPTFSSTTPALTDSNGYYLLSNLPVGESYHVVASSEDYYIDPGNLYLGYITKDETVNFVARRFFNISGRVTAANGSGIAGVSIHSSGEEFGSWTDTDSNGNYRLNYIVEGSTHPLTISASSAYVFNPSATVITNVSQNTVVNFVGHLASTRYAMYGFIRDANGLNLDGVRVSLTGSLSGTVLTNANGLYRFDNLEAGGTYTITPTLNGRAFSPSNRTVASLSADTGGDFVGTANSIDNARFFVTQHYQDFFSREPDASGLNFWTAEITSCGSNPACIETKRINVSAAFFLSIEFQETGYLVYRIYKTAYGNLPGAPVPIKLNEFLPDTQQIGLGVVVGASGWEQLLLNNKNAFVGSFVARSRFTTAFPNTWTPAQFVDKLFQNAGVTPSVLDRAAAINEFAGATNSANTSARARALRRVAENVTLAQQERNKAFVLTQYFGYLRRNPNDPPELGLNFNGYNYWLTKLNDFNGNHVAAEMVKAFIDSSEYRQRF